ncbi:MAG: polysaccharide biosynthesis C-terminal domain-containing protein [Bacteroidota bacterium]|nr:polysaccharide biosynthesis C-terminal domain-containing protein [Bacteroidota bacterium]MDX5431433.1 polysaccharide biosynthesis C-terminal domain-containing protein [Bacteroidota bacterium]MDX5470161.1 polysaccharide biosynthesis C-terminal domain-containing protein [Bacteroidota bacterium]
MKGINRHIIWQFFTRFGAALFNLLIGIIISRYLGSEGRGIHGLFIASVALIHLCTNWLGGASLVYLSSRHPVRQLTWISFWWSSGFAILCWVILQLSGIMPEGYEWAVLICSLLFAWWNNLANMLLGKEKTQAYNTLQVIHPMLSALVLMVFFYWVETGFTSFIWAYGSAQLVNLGLAVKYLKEDYQASDRKKDPQLFRVFIRHGLFIQLANLTQFFNYRMVYFLIDSHFGKQVLGVYSNALSLAESVWMITRSISTVQFARIANSESTKFSQKLTQQYGGISLVVSALGVVFLLLLPDAFFVWLFGDEFAGISHHLLLLSPAILSMSLGNIYAHYFAGLGMNRVNFVGSLLNLVVILVSFYWLMDLIQVDAAPVSSSIAFTVAMVYHYLRFKREKRLRG